MHYPDSRWRPHCQGKSRDDVSGRISGGGGGERGPGQKVKFISFIYNII